MKHLRKRFISKFIAAFFLLLTVESVVQPTISYALTTGPHQPEYTSYEEPGATDMVNLLTGDFTTSLPILEVPGPEGSFSVPLTYNAGIGPDQEASWVGLGWTLNVGAITRSVVQYPDDASGEVQTVSRKDLIGVRGWTSNALGGQMGWNTSQGQYGSLSLFGVIEASWDNKGNTVGVAGISVGASGLSFDVVKFTIAALTIASTISGLGAAAKPLEKAINIASLAEPVGLSFATANKTPDAPNDGYWQYSKKTSSGFMGLWTDYWIWLDQTRYEEMLGVLYFDKAQLQLHNPPNFHGIPPVSFSYSLNGSSQTAYEYPKTGGNQGIASDISYYIPNGVSFQDATSPVSLATDNYSVKAPGISGSIKPYRLDVSSVSMPREMSIYHSRLALVPPQPHKVPFIYEGVNSNSHFYHVGDASSVTQPEFYYGLSRTTGAGSYLNYALNDVVFEDRIRPDLVSNPKIPMSNHTEWLSNEEIGNQSAGFPTGFMDYFSGTDRYNFRTEFSFGPPKILYSSSTYFNDGKIYLQAQDISQFSMDEPVSLKILTYAPGTDPYSDGYTEYDVETTVTAINTTDLYVTVDPTDFVANVSGQYCNIQVFLPGQKRANSIGGYSITGVNGLTYHFALPSYEYSNYTRIQDPVDSTTKYSEIKRDEPFASTWLLTGITGPDFVDRGGAGNGPDGVIDTTDWGHWVKFTYGKYTEDFQWNIPYNGTTLDATATSKTRSEGHKQIYYLNSIETRSHVALFLKDLRSDNRGKNVGGTAANAGLSLSLYEIDLMNRQNYQKLFKATDHGGFGLTSDAGLSHLSAVYMKSNFLSTSGLNPASFISQNVVKRIRFGQTYDLSPGTTNSADTNQGKLTLTRLSIMGRNDMKLLPDYLFEYGNNPIYGARRWDGWGMYQSLGLASHSVSESDTDGAAWSLTKLTNPLGSTIEVTYERDDYSSISGNLIINPDIASVANSFAYNGHNMLGWNALKVPNTSVFSVGEIINVAGNFDYSCNLQYELSDGPPGHSGQYSGNFTIQSIVGGSLILDNFRGNADCGGQAGFIVNDTGVIKRILKTRKGGNIRVATLSLKDQGTEFKTQYLYTKDNNFSAGVVAREPDYISTQDYPFYNLPGYPFTPVMYSRVTVLTGTLSNSSDYHTKQVYEFETPRSTMVTNQGVSDDYYTLVHSDANGSPDYYNGYFKQTRSEISDSTSKIGKLKSSKMYDHAGTLVSSSVMNYAPSVSSRNPDTGALETKYQGVYSEGTLMFDRVGVIAGIGDNTLYDYNKMARTTILKFPYELVKVTNSKDGFTSETENIGWDFISGIVVEKNAKSPLGLRSKSVTKLAYNVSDYSGMGSKALNADNKNMLGHEAATYNYRIADNGSIIGLISATAQTWNQTWNYRVLDGSNYDDADTESGTWRKHKNYVYQGSYGDLRTDGTGTLNFTSSNEFDFGSSAANTGWLKVGEVTRYDHFSTDIEGKDLHGIFSSSKKDINAQQIYASASNAGYNEFAYSGAEDWAASGSGSYLGGEVAKGDGSSVTGTSGIETHTGVKAAQVSSTGKTFIFKPSSLTNNRVYRVSAWTNSSNGAIYYKVGTDAEQTITPTTMTRAGSTGTWYQINAEIPITTFSSLEVGVKSTSGTVTFDDFRFQPRDGAVTANVYDPVTGEVTFSLDNQNMFTKYEYNDRGQLVKTYTESFRYGMKLTTENKMNYRRFTTNQ